MMTARRYTQDLLLELYTELTTLIPCFTDTETFERAITAPWFQDDVKNISNRFYHLARIVYGKHARGRDFSPIPKHISSFMPANVAGLYRFENDVDIHRIVKYGDWFLQYLKDGESANRLLKRLLPEAEEEDRYYALNYSKCPRDELQRHMKAYETRTHKRSLAFWARDFEVSMRKARVSISKIKNALEDWLSDERLGKATVISDGVETSVVYPSRKRKNENIPIAPMKAYPRKLRRYE